MKFYLVDPIIPTIHTRILIILEIQILNLDNDPGKQSPIGNESKLAYNWFIFYFVHQRVQR